jgi:hypothetical protein
MGGGYTSFDVRIDNATSVKYGTGEETALNLSAFSSFVSEVSISKTGTLPRHARDSIMIYYVTQRISK